MANTTSNQELGERIERLVQEHIATTRRAAQDAVERAFASATVERERTRVPRQVKSSGGVVRRTSGEMAALANRFYEAVCAKPGETMTVLMGDVGASARELGRPVALLKRAGRIRTVGVSSKDPSRRRVLPPRLRPPPARQRLLGSRPRPSRLRPRPARTAGEGLPYRPDWSGGFARSSRRSPPTVGPCCYAAVAPPEWSPGCRLDRWSRTVGSSRSRPQIHSWPRC